MDRERFEQLSVALDKAQADLREHWDTLKRQLWYNDQPGNERGNGPWDEEWRAEHAPLQAARDEAEKQLERHLWGEH